MPIAVSIKGAYSPGEKTWPESSLKAEKVISPTSSRSPSCFATGRRSYVKDTWRSQFRDLQTKIRLYNHRMLILPQILLPQEDSSIDSELHSWKGCKAQVLQRKAKIEKGDKTITLEQFLQPAILPCRFWNCQTPQLNETSLKPRNHSLSLICVYSHAYWYI